MGQGLATPPPPPPHAYRGCRGTIEGLGALGRVSAPSPLPWPRRGLPERPVGANVAPVPPALAPPVAAPPSEAELGAQRPMGEDGPAMSRALTGSRAPPGSPTTPPGRVGE